MPTHVAVELPPKDRSRPDLTQRLSLTDRPKPTRAERKSFTFRRSSGNRENPKFRDGATASGTKGLSSSLPLRRSS